MLPWNSRVGTDSSSVKPSCFSLIFFFFFFLIFLSIPQCEECVVVAGSCSVCVFLRQRGFTAENGWRFLPPRAWDVCAAFPRDANWPSAVLCVRVVVSSGAEGQPVAMLVPAQRPTVRPQCSQVVQDPCCCRCCCLPSLPSL